MNVKELKAILENYDEELEVWVFCAGYGNPFPAEVWDVYLSQESNSYREPLKEVLMIGKE